MTAPVPFVPPALPDRRALGRAALLTTLANGVAAVITLVLLAPVLDTAASRPDRLRALQELGVWFRLGWLLWIPASLSLLVLAVAWGKACRAGGLAGAAVPLVTVAAGVDVLAEVLYLWLLPRALAMPDPGAVVLADDLLATLVGLPATLLYALGLTLLVLRSARRRLLPRWLLLGGVPLLLASAWVVGAAALGQSDAVWAGGRVWFPALVLWQAALAGWCLRGERRG